MTADKIYGDLCVYHAALPSSQVICLYGSDHRSILFGRLGGAACWAAYRLLDGGSPIIERFLAVACACERWASREESHHGRHIFEDTTRPATVEDHGHRRTETSHEDLASDHQRRVIGRQRTAPARTIRPDGPGARGAAGAG